MEKNQKINCTVTNCKYNDQENAKCNLESIHVMPNERKDKKEQSKCASYEFEGK